MELFKGYVPTRDKKCLMKFKGGKDLLTIDQVRELDEYAGILADGIILVDFDDEAQGDTMMSIVRDKGLKCRVYKTTRGRHFVFANSGVQKCGTSKRLGIGLTADIKVGDHNSYEILKFGGVERTIERDADVLDKLPKWLHPVPSKHDFTDMGDGEGRNSALFSYELTLQSNGFEVDEAKECIRIINDYVLPEPLSRDEIDTVTRDEAFMKPIFYDGKAFMHNRFAQFIKSEYHVKRINGQLHAYDAQRGIYQAGTSRIESKMVEVIPTIKAAQRVETMKFLEVTTVDNSEPSDANLIVFRNGVYDFATGELMPFSPSHIITNAIPWDWNPRAYSELADKTLDKLACNDPEVRALLEECIGYCFFRQNELSKAFFLTGTGSNGKSTYLDMIKTVLGRDNFVSLDLNEMSEKFSVSTMFGKLANIGDDISDEFLTGNTVSHFKKIVSGNDIKAENKGELPFFFKPTCKLLFSANEIPRMRNKGFYAVMRRMVIIPFNAQFSKDDPDFDAGITWKLRSQEVAEYLVRLGMEGLMRVLENQAFTESSRVARELGEFERENNPIIDFIDELDESDILNHESREVFARYDVWCYERGMTKMAMQTMSKEINKRLGTHLVDRKVGGKKCRIFVRK